MYYRTITSYYLRYYGIIDPHTSFHPKPMYAKIPIYLPYTPKLAQRPTSSIVLLSRKIRLHKPHLHSFSYVPHSVNIPLEEASQEDVLMLILRALL